MILIVMAFMSLTAACAPASTPSPEPRVIAVYSAPSTQPWLADVFTCAPAGTVVRVANSPDEADLSLRIGEPEILAVPAFQIDTEDILVVAHRQSAAQNMELEGVRALFAGQGDPSVQVWVYAAGEDVQEAFEQAVMAGRSVTSLARLATNPQQMSDTLNNTPNAIGILTRRWKVGDSRVVYSIPDVPVLALAEEDAEESIRALVACIQE